MNFWMSYNVFGVSIFCYQELQIYVKPDNVIQQNSFLFYFQIYRRPGYCGPHCISPGYTQKESFNGRDSS